MITKLDLESAIAECQGERNPNANTCIKLAAFYTIRKELFGEDIPRQHNYSFAAMPETEVETTVNYESDTEFSMAINGRIASDMWKIMDELMTTLQVLNPRLYNGVMRQIDA